MKKYLYKIVIEYKIEKKLRKKYPATEISRLDKFSKQIQISTNSWFTLLSTTLPSTFLLTSIPIPAFS